MAAPQALLLVLHQSTWQLARLTPRGVETTPPAELDWTHAQNVARQIRAALDAWHCKTRSIVVALESPLCVSVLLRLPSQKQARQRQTLYYLLEPFLPWSAEEIVADYECSKTDAFATAISLEPISALIDGLEEHGIQVESIAPLARLALERQLTQLSMGTSRFLCLWVENQSVELWLIDRKRPVLWRHLELDAGSILQELKEIALEEPQPLTLLAHGLPHEMTAKLSTLSNSIHLEVPQGASPPMLESALQTAGAVLAGAKASPVEFRRDGLAPREGHRSLHANLQAVQIALLCLLTTIGFALYQIGNQFEDLRLQAGDRQAELFRQLFPGAPVPVGVRLRLESEHAKLMAMRGDTVELPTSTSAVHLIERLLRSLPADMRYRILEVRVEQGRLYVLGQVREHADADRIAEELRKAKLVVESPSTHRLPERGVEFRISANFPKESASTSGVNL